MKVSRRTFLRVGAAGSTLTLGGMRGFPLPLMADAAEPVTQTPPDTEQIAIPRIEEMPNIPRQFKVRDWRQVVVDLDAYLFDLDATGPYLPLIWIDKSHANFHEDTFGLYVTVDDPRCGPKENDGQFHDAVCDIPALIAATLVGIDKSNQSGRDWIRMARAFFRKSDGSNVFKDMVRNFSYKVGGAQNIDFWYDTLPSILFAQLVSL